MLSRHVTFYLKRLSLSRHLNFCITTFPKIVSFNFNTFPSRQFVLAKNCAGYKHRRTLTEQSPGYSQTGRIGRAIEELREFLKIRHIAHFAAAKFLEVVVEWHPWRPTSRCDPRAICHVRFIVRRRGRSFHQLVSLPPHNTASRFCRQEWTFSFWLCFSITYRSEKNEKNALYFKGRDAVTFLRKILTMGQVAHEWIEGEASWSRT